MDGSLGAAGSRDGDDRTKQIHAVSTGAPFSFWLRFCPAEIALPVWDAANVRHGLTVQFDENQLRWIEPGMKEIADLIDERWRTPRAA